MQVNVKDFGAVGDGITDDYAAIMAAINSVSCNPDGWLYPSGPSVYFPLSAKAYRVNQPIELKKSVRLFADGSGMAHASTARLHFPNSAGIIVQRYNTTGQGIETPATTGGDASIIEGLTIIGASGEGRHGISLRGRALIRNCLVKNFGGNGINVVGTAGGVPDQEGNANCFRIEGGRCYGNGGHGLYVDGADANAGYAIGLDVSGNGGYGIYDSSFLGNTYVAIHSADNALGSYKSDNANARNLFLGCYSEGGQPAGDIAFPSLAIGGLHGSGLTPNTHQIVATGGVLQFQPSFGTKTMHIGIGGEPASGDGLVMKDTQGFYSWALAKAPGRWGYKWANLGAPGFINFYDRGAKPENGYARDLSAGHGAIGIGPYYFGKITEMSYRGLGTAPPTTGAFLKGDRIDNSSPTELGDVGAKYVITGWICTVTGSPGTWVQMRSLTGN